MKQTFSATIFIVYLRAVYMQGWIGCGLLMAGLTASIVFCRNTKLTKIQPFQCSFRILSVLLYSYFRIPLLLMLKIKTCSTQLQYYADAFNWMENLIIYIYASVCTQWWCENLMTFAIGQHQVVIKYCWKNFNIFTLLNFLYCLHF